jgi:hypothetical protein
VEPFFERITRGRPGAACCHDARAQPPRQDVAVPDRGESAPDAGGRGRRRARHRREASERDA